jgi:hypothetical protein
MNMLRPALLALVLLAGCAMPAEPHPIPEDARWLVYPAGDGPGAGRHIVLIAADQEYRSEESLPMLARTLSAHHGFHCTVLFSVNEDGHADPTRKIRWEDETVMHHIPGLEHLADADLLILFSRLITLPKDEQQHLIDYFDSGKPIIGLRTANHGFIDLDYQVDGERVRFGDEVLGGSFRGHHGRWHADSTRGFLEDENAAHPVLTGVSDIWGPSDVYRTYPEDEALPDRCACLVWGQPLMGRSEDDAINEDLIMLPVAWTTSWTGAQGIEARVFHSTMGSARDFESAGLRRLLFNASYWCLGLEDAIEGDASVQVLGDYEPKASGFDYPALGVTPHPPAHYR